MPLRARHQDARAITTVVAAVAEAGVNLISPKALSRRRRSHGCAARERRRALARCAWAGFIRASRSLAKDGRFDGFAGAASGKELNAAFR